MKRNSSLLRAHCGHALVFGAACGGALLCPSPAVVWAAEAPATADQAALAARLAKAKPGSVVTLEAKTYNVGDVSVPAGVTLRGAGFQKTIINAAGFKNGIVIGAGKGAKVMDLTVKGARETGISVSGATGVVLSRLQVSSNLTGLLLSGVTGGRYENLLVTRNRTGASVTGNKESVLVNCSFADNPAIALTVAGSAGKVAIFNNLYVNSPTAVYLAANNVGLTLDHNFYIASFIGKLEGEVSRTTLAGWQRVSGHDGHSLSTPLTFANPEADDYHPVSVLNWNPNLATTSDWGAANLAGYNAPTTDIEGKPRSGGVDLGVFEVAIATGRKPDGTFEIKNGNGAKSAGLFNADGVSVTTYFQNLPLAAGRHPFYLPARDNRNLPLLPGKYEVRIAESQLSNQYLGLAGNFSPTADRLGNCSWPEEMMAFDKQDRLYVAQNAFENGMGIRAFDPTYQKPRWMMPGGGGNVGVATDDKYFYYVQQQGNKQYNLRKIDLETGVMTALVPGAGNRILTEVAGQTVYGMALLDGKLYLSVPSVGKIYVAPADNPVFTPFADLKGASSITVDPQNKRLWVLGEGGEIFTVDAASGQASSAGKPVAGPKCIGANNGRLAVLSPETGKIHVFDASQAGKLVAQRTIGTGDGPYGEQKPDRFWFQSDGTDRQHKTHVAINSLGEVVVVDDLRVSFWGADGSLKKQGMGFWGQHNYYAKLAGDDDVRFWGISGDYSIKMDSKNHKWTPDRRWQLPAYDFDGRSPRNYFTTGGKNFAMYEVSIGNPTKQADKKLLTRGYAKDTRLTAFLVTRLDEKKAVPVSLYYHASGAESAVEVHDTNGDGMIDGADEGKAMARPDGGQVNLPMDRYHGLPRPNGDMVFTNGGPAQIGVLIRMKGLDPTGTYPIFDFANPEPIPCTVDGKSAQFVSPYDYKTKENANAAVQIAQMSDGGYASSAALRSSGGTGLANGAGTDIGGFGKDGRMRWLFKLNTVQGSEGVQSIPEYKMVMGMTSTQCDYMVMDEDGLGLGVLSMPQEAHWHGMWSDHAQQQQTWVGNDGKPYYILGDYAANGYHWFQITGAEKTRHASVAVEVDASKAELLAKMPALVPEKLPTPPTTKVVVRRLEAPMTIDGDLKKWRTAGIAPAALVTPETGTADIVGPQDCSAVIRLAYQGNDLYVQTISFDNVVTFHQPLDKMYQQDGVEMGVNSFMQGFKFNVANTTDHGATVFRNKFVVASMERLFNDTQVPRSIKVYDDASQVEERKFIEAIYGVDLSKSKVIVTEFKLPLTPEVGLDGDPKMVKVAPGESFWIGFFLNDNDMPGGDVQKFLAWPATYGTFAVKEAGALATFE